VTSIHVDDLDRIAMPDGFVWRPIRRHFGIRAFGVNAYTAEVGSHIVERHTENTYGHEEIYLVLRGRALFTVDENEHELIAGQLVHVSDPTLRREAVALDADTVVLAFGGQPGVAHEPTPWEAMFAANPAYLREDWDEAIRIHEEALAERPDSAPLLFNLACMEARAGKTVDALLHLRRAVDLDPKWADEATRDTDFDSIRAEPGFAS
jgi:tetratricopeptide (TPR) repeat protein